MGFLVPNMAHTWLTMIARWLLESFMYIFDPLSNYLRLSFWWLPTILELQIEVVMRLVHLVTRRLLDGVVKAAFFDIMKSLFLSSYDWKFDIYWVCSLFHFSLLFFSFAWQSLDSVVGYIHYGIHLCAMC